MRHQHALQQPLRRLTVALLAALAGFGSSSILAQPLIGAIQGAAHISPLRDTNVSNVAGIVTAVSTQGFWIQDGGDANPLTSDGIFVFRGSSGTKPNVGDAVTVVGRVQEFRPGNDANNLTNTQINASSTFSGAWTRSSAGNALPVARAIDTGFLPPSLIAPAVGNVETAIGYTLNPSAYSMDFYESLEGMRVTLPSARVVGATNNFGEVSVVASAQFGTGSSVWTPRGGVSLAPGQFNGQRLYIDDLITAAPVVNVGAQLSGVTGVMDFSFSNYKLQLTQAPTVVSNTLTAEQASIGTGRFGLGSYNVENMGGNASAQKIAAVATQISTNLGAPHIVALQEIQDNNGATNNGVVAADLTLNNLATAVNGLTGRSYSWVNVNPANNADGGQPGGNIRTAFLYDTSRVSFSGVVGGSLVSIAASAGAGGQIVLSLGAGRIDPTNAAFGDSRKPLVTEFTVDGQQLILINNHLNSKGGDQPLYGPNQAPVNSSETQRLAQAQVVASFVSSLLAINPNANIVVMGDLNDFQFATSLAPLTAAGLTNMTLSLPENERYAYNFQGNAQALDHMFVSANLLAKGDLLYDVVHVNSEFNNATGSFRASDHDPLLLSFAGVPAPVPEPAALALMLAGLLAVMAAARRGRR